MFDLTIKAFNMADVYRQPVFVLGDEAVGHPTERVIIPEASAIPYMPRKPPFRPGQGLASTRPSMTTPCRRCPLSARATAST